MSLQCDNYKPDTQMASSSFLFLLATLLLTTKTTATNSSSPKPTPWPLQFHSILFVNYTNSLSLIDLWYDWPNGRNYNIIQDQLGDGILYDAEWNNGSIFTFHKDREYCRTAEIDVGILRPNWMDGADYVGREMVDGFVCNVWEKVGFILYYEDVVSNRPVHWVFYTGRSIHVMTFEVGAVLEDVVWQAPAYCFQGNDTKIGGLEPGYRKKVGYLEPPVKTI